jgi:phage protein D
MPNVEYRLFFKNKPATREQLDRIDEITIEQEVDMAWEARFTIPICTDENGKWVEQNEDFMTEFSRIRVEIKVGEKAFVPLIDGSVVGFDSQLNSQPGQSTITLRVQDDSVYLNRDDRIARFDKLKDHEIADKIFSKVSQIATKKIDKTPAANTMLPTAVVQRGTDIQILRSLAQRQGMHVYVLPGDKPGKSVGYFQTFPTKPSGLPPLILLGRDRNIATFDVQNNAQSPAQFETQSISIANKTITKVTSQFRNLELLGKEAAFQKEENTAKRLLPPRHGDAVDPRQAANAAMLRSSYAFSATGSVLGDCYTGVLEPYQVITVQGVNEHLSGDYLITKVTHQLTRSNYSQNFTMWRNARSKGATANNNAGLPSISAGVSVSLNISGGII